MLPTARAPAPVLVRVTFCGALLVPTRCGANDRLAGLRLAAPCGAGMPLPLRGTVWTLPGESSWKTRAADRGPVAVGLKATLTAQLAFGAWTNGTAPHVLEAIEKSPGLRFERLMLLTFSGSVPVLVSVTLCVALVDWTCWSAKVNAAGARLATAVGSPGAVHGAAGPATIPVPFSNRVFSTKPSGLVPNQMMRESASSARWTSAALRPV